MAAIIRYGDLVDSVVECVLKTVPPWARVGARRECSESASRGTAEKSMLMAKKWVEPIDRFDLLARGPRNDLEWLRIELYEKVNALGVGAQGLGGLTTVLDVKIATRATHAACKPVAMIPNCAATRHAHVVLDGSGPAFLAPPILGPWPDVHWVPDYNKSRRVDLDRLTRHEVAKWKASDTYCSAVKCLPAVTPRTNACRRFWPEGSRCPSSSRTGSSTTSAPRPPRAWTIPPR
jgi:fumarate hydratase class I